MDGALEPREKRRRSDSAFKPPDERIHLAKVPRAMPALRGDVQPARERGGLAVTEHSPRRDAKSRLLRDDFVHSRPPRSECNVHVSRSPPPEQRAEPATAPDEIPPGHERARRVAEDESSQDAFGAVEQGALAARVANRFTPGGHRGPERRASKFLQRPCHRPAVASNLVDPVDPVPERRREL